MNTNIQNIAISQLKKLEVQFLASSVIEIVQKHDPEILLIKDIFDKLVELEPQIGLLKIPYGPHPMTAELKKMRRRRIAYAQEIINRIHTMEYAKVEGTEGSIMVAKPIVHRYLKGLSNNSQKAINQTVVQFLDTAKKDENFKTALLDLDLMSYVENLELVNTDVNALYNQRRESLSARPKGITPEVKAAIKVALENLFKQIEIAQVKNAELPYKPLIDELNLEISKAKAEIKARASYNKKKAEEALDDNEVVVENDDEVVVESQPEESSQSTMSAPEMSLMRAEMENGEDFGGLDIKKTVAVSTKQTRLPVISNEA